MKHIYIFRRVSFSYIYIFGLTKYTLAILLKKCSCFCSCFSLHYPMLIFQIKRIISSEKWFNYIVTFFFFWKCPKFGSVSRMAYGNCNVNKKQEKRKMKWKNIHCSLLWHMLLSFSDILKVAFIRGFAEKLIKLNGFSHFYFPCMLQICVREK